MENESQINDKEILDSIINLIQSTPNNYELGEKLRKKYWEELSKL